MVADLVASLCYARQDLRVLLRPLTREKPGGMDTPIVEDAQNGGGGSYFTTSIKGQRDPWFGCVAAVDGCG